MNLLLELLIVATTFAGTPSASHYGSAHTSLGPMVDESVDCVECMLHARVVAMFVHLGIQPAAVQLMQKLKLSCLLTCRGSRASC